jgi:hypothetical protein
MLDLIKGLFNQTSPFTPLEKTLLGELTAKLDPPVKELFEQQTNLINTVQRLADDREVNCYCVRKGKPYRDSRLQFPDSAAEARLARIDFTVPGSQKKWSASFITVKGQFFTIEFNASPRAIKTQSNLNVTLVDISSNMNVDAVEPDRTLPRLPIESLKGWIQPLLADEPNVEWEAPLGKAELEDVLANLDSTLPADYLEAIRQLDGVLAQDYRIFGADGIYRITLPQQSYYVLAELFGQGVLAVRADARDGQVYFLGYDSDGAVGVPSFREAIANR